MLRESCGPLDRQVRRRAHRHPHFGHRV